MPYIACLNSATRLLVDAADYDLVAAVPWLDIRGRPVTVVPLTARRIECSRLLVDARSPAQVDHIDGNPFNCRRENLRIVTAQQNAWNRSKAARTRSGNAPTSIYKGVCQKRQRETLVPIWIACIQGDYLGSYTTPELAAKAYDREAQLRYGPYARLNFPLHGRRACTRDPLIGPDR